MGEELPCDTIIGMCDPLTRCTITDRGLRCTAQREAVLHALQQAKDHPTAEMLHGRLEGVSLATVYNALQVFRRVGLAQAVSIPGGMTRWDGDVGPHVHLMAIDSDEVRDLPDAVAAPLLDGLTPEKLAQVADTLGVCIDQVQISLLVPTFDKADA